MPTLGPMELCIIMIFGVLIFGKRLPEIGRSLGKGIVEFKKGLNGIQSELENATRVDAPTRKESYWSAPDAATAEPSVPKFEPSVPKFEPPVSAPVETAARTASD